MMTPLLTIVICTFNRGTVLGESLNSFLETHLFDCPVEVLIVDNNSTDNTVEVSKQCIARDPVRIRYVHESQQGLSNARNAGIKNAKAEIIAFVDDDVYFTPDWAGKILGAFKQQPKASGAAGKIIPTFEAGKPPWLTEMMLGYYGQTNFGDTPRWVVYPEHPFGGNMAFKREVFASIGDFNPRLGRDGKRLLSNEELEFFHRVSESKLKVHYNPDALIYHRIPRERTTPDWVIDRAYWQGVSGVVFNQILTGSSRLQLFQDSIPLLRQIWKQFTGGAISPRRIYWHYAKRTVQSRVNHALQTGKFRGLWGEILRT